jgi:hypothetical protein
MFGGMDTELITETRLHDLQAELWSAARHEAQLRELAEPRPGRRTAPTRWLGRRLVALGWRLQSEPATPVLSGK